MTNLDYFLEDLSNPDTRLIASDLLEEQGRGLEAKLLRSGLPVRTVEGKVRPLFRFKGRLIASAEEPVTIHIEAEICWGKIEINTGEIKFNREKIKEEILPGLNQFDANERDAIADWMAGRVHDAEKDTMLSPGETYSFVSSISTSF